MGSNISKIGDPRSIWLDGFKLTIQDVGCNMAQTPTFETTVSLIAPLGTDVGFSHNAVHAILTARLPVVFHIQRDVSIAIRKSALYPKLFDLPEQTLILNGPLALGLFEPGIESAGMNFQHSTHEERQDDRSKVDRRVGIPSHTMFCTQIPTNQWQSLLPS